MDRETDRMRATKSRAIDTGTKVSFTPWSTNMGGADGLTR